MREDGLSSAIEEWARGEVRRIGFMYGPGVDAVAVELQAPDEFLLQISDPMGRGAPGVARLGDRSELEAEIFFTVELYALPTAEAKPHWRHFLWSSDILHDNASYYVRGPHGSFVTLREDGPPALKDGLDLLVRGEGETRRAFRQHRLQPYGFL